MREGSGGVQPDSFLLTSAEQPNRDAQRLLRRPTGLAIGHREAERRKIAICYPHLVYPQARQSKQPSLKINGLPQSRQG
jgi:hypothetical protein